MASNKEDNDTSKRLYPIRIFGMDDSDEDENSGEPDITMHQRPAQDQRGQGRGRSRGDGRWRRADQYRDTYDRSLSHSRGTNADEKSNRDANRNNNDTNNVGDKRGRGRYSRKLAAESGVRGRNRGRGSGRGRGHQVNSDKDRNIINDSVDRHIASGSDSCKAIDDNNSNSIATKREVQPMEFHKLIHLSKQSDDPDRILLEISNSRSGFKEFVSGHIEAKCYFILFRLLKIVMGTHQLQGRRQLLQLLEQHLLPKLPEFLNDIFMRSQDTRYLWNKKSDLAILISNLTSIISKTMEVLPSSLSKCSVIILQLQQVQLNLFQDGSHPNVANDIEEAKLVLAAMCEEKEKLRREQEEKYVKPKRKKTTAEESCPPEDFRTLSILPTLVDLQMDEKPFLRANKAKGQYDSLDTYLDIQFRLLREDYISPLRNGISMYRECLKTKGNVSKLRDIRLYHDVQITRPICSSSGINHMIQFDVSKFKRMNWAASKRLLHGSLLCLSNDDFDTAIYAIVMDRKEKELSEGILQVHFENLPDWIQGNDKFVMAESTTYFEAYRHILLGLQATDFLPLYRYIIECETLVKPPEYLLYESDLMYNFNTLMTKTSNEMFPVLDIAGWPSKSRLRLDASQYEALKAAISKELAIIQGPPGTGKTYVGLKIAKLLIENKKIWQRSKKEGRHGCHAILVVCYTNHALDQFLEGIHEFSKEGIVRIGGRCNSEVLEEYVLKNIKQRNRQDRSRPWGIRQGEMDCRKELRECERLITEVSIELKKSRTEIISLDKLSQFMTADQISAFTAKIKKESDKGKCMYEWMSLSFREPDTQTTSVDELERVKRLWETYIIEKAERLPSNVANSPSVWQLELQDRARLYKTWIYEFIGIIELKLLDIRRRGNVSSLQAAEDILEKLILYTEMEIVGESTLTKYIENPVYLSQIKQVANVDFPTDRAMNVWLCLNKTNESTSAIKSALEKIENVEETGNDLAEERGLFEEDNFIDYYDDDYVENMKKSEDEHWIMNWEKKKTKQEVTAMLRKAKPLSKEQSELLEEIWNLPLNTRRNLYCHWLEEYQKYLREKVKEEEKHFNDATIRFEEVREQETLSILKTANFIGMTTTGAAKYRKLLQQVAPRIIIVEEAAEVLESHIITTLHDECKHLILIGDHKQLRPSTTVYELSKRYNLDISLFERLVNNGVPCVSLTEQHRMRPSISTLMRHPNLYPNLRDHPVVHTYENVKGLDVNVQFISHEKAEETNAESTSYYNTFEAKFVANFCSHLLKQGYTPDQITVLSPYMGQVLTIRKEMPKAEFAGVRITAVDNYQGEENDVILLSLVRSSKPGTSDKRNPIGFLGIENRVCVALSRAKIGLFVFGNFDLLQKSSEIWKYMVNSVGKVSPTIKLICQNHPQNVTEVGDPKDFGKVPEGGCREPCGTRLNCGHICERYCHITDKDHKFTKCFKPCQKTCEFGHRCKKKCFQECKECETLVEKQIPMCGHTISIPCYKDPASWKCEKSCTYTLSCGHKCGQACHKCFKNSHTVNCKRKCERTLGCGHTVKVECHQGIDVECTAQCDTVLDCGHPCAGKCGICLNGKIHSGCKGSCTKTLPCGHKCAFPCSEICPPCTRKCEQRCPHMVKCSKTCSAECSPCIEDCSFRCHHKRCQKLCHERCGDVRCDKPCPLRAQNQQEKCNHKCSGLCGETCPKICVECNQDKVNDKDYTYAAGDRFIELPDCGHIIEVNRLDAAMLKPLDPRGETVKRCPKGKCKRVIRTDIRRYSKELKDARQATLARFNHLSGTEEERTQKADSLKKVIDRLRTVGSGLNENDITILKKQVNPSKFGKLLVVTRKIEVLKSILEIRKEFTSFAVSSMPKEHLEICSNGIEDAKAMHAVLLRDKQYATKQYWRELGLEIVRLQNLMYFMQLRERKYGYGFGDSIVESYFKKSMIILTDGKPFDQTRADLIDKVKDRLTNKTLAVEKSIVFDPVRINPSPENIPTKLLMDTKERVKVQNNNPFEKNAKEEIENDTKTHALGLRASDKFPGRKHSSNYLVEDSIAEIEMGSDAISDDTKESKTIELQKSTSLVHTDEALVRIKQDGEPLHFEVEQPIKNIFNPPEQSHDVYLSATVLDKHPHYHKKPLDMHILQEKTVFKKEQDSRTTQAIINKNAFEEVTITKPLPRPRTTLRSSPDKTVEVKTDFDHSDAMRGRHRHEHVSIIQEGKAKLHADEYIENLPFNAGTRPKVKETEARRELNLPTGKMSSVADKIALWQTRNPKQTTSLLLGGEEFYGTQCDSTSKYNKQIKINKTDMARQVESEELSSGIDLKPSSEAGVDIDFGSVSGVKRRKNESFKDLADIAKQAYGQSTQEVEKKNVQTVECPNDVERQPGERFGDLVQIAKQQCAPSPQAAKLKNNKTFRFIQRIFGKDMND